MEELSGKSLAEFAELLASAEPVPGGGGASALAGALGAALCSMTANLTVGKKKYAGVEEDVKAMLAQADELRERFIHCVGEDAKAFEPLSRAYAISKDDPRRDEIMQKCLIEAASVPMEILRLCCEAIELLGQMEIKGSRMMISDVGTGAALCRAALQGAAINVKVNTKLMSDRVCASGFDEQVARLTEKYDAIAAGIYERVMAIYK